MGLASSLGYQRAVAPALGIGVELSCRFLKLAVGFQRLSVAIARVGVAYAPIKGCFIIRLGLVEPVGKAQRFADAKVGLRRIFTLGNVGFVKLDGRLVFALLKAFVRLGDAARSGTAAQQHGRTGCRPNN